MTSVFASRRRAEEFHSLVDAPAAGAVRDARAEEFLAIVESLRAVPEPEPRPAFVASLREELLTAADTLLAPEPDARLSLPPRNARRDRRIAAAIGGLAVVGAGTSMAVAAQSALPGEMLYPLKRAIEDAESGVSSPDAKGATLLDMASTRLSEIRTLDREGHLADEPAAVATSLTDFADQSSRASDYILDDFRTSDDRRLIRELRDFTGSSMNTLQSLRSRIPSSARDELLAAVEVVSEIDARARQACPDCGGRGVEQVPPVLLTSAATGTPLVVIPGATVESWRPRSGGRRGGSDGTGPVGDLTGPLLAAPDDGSGAGDGDTGDGATGPLSSLTDPLTGDGKSPASNGAGDVGKKVDDTLDGAKKGLDDVTQDLEKTTDDLGDTLLGD